MRSASWPPHNALEVCRMLQSYLLPAPVSPAPAACAEQRLTSLHELLSGPRAAAAQCGAADPLQAAPAAWLCALRRGRLHPSSSDGGLLLRCSGGRNSRSCCMRAAQRQEGRAQGRWR